MKIYPGEAAFLAFCILFGIALLIVLIAALFYLIGIWTVIIGGIFLVTWGLVYFIGNKDWKETKNHWEKKYGSK